MRAFAIGAPPESVRAAADEIGDLLTDEWFQRSPDSVLFELGCYYDPTSEHLSPSEWLRQAQQILRGAG